MKFSEKLQNLRKQNNLSQEQLADQLDVSRQSVSKWESGTTYPEMDKLLTLCKIFKISLDELTNDEITEIATNSKKNNITNFMDEMLDIFKNTIKMFKNMKFKDYILFSIELLIITLLIFLLKLPFNYIGNLASNIFFNISLKVGAILSSIFDFILAISYIVISFFIFIYIFKVRHLDEIKNQEIIEEEIELIIEKDNNSDKTPKIKVVKERKPSIVFRTLGKLIVFFIKTMTLLFSLPFVGLLLALAVAFAIAFILIFKGVFFGGILIALLGGILFTIVIIQIIYYLLFNKKVEVKRTFIMFIIAILSIGIGLGISAIEIANIKYLTGEYKDQKQEIIKKEYKFNKEMSLDFYYQANSIEYQEDETLKDKIIIEVIYYKEFSQFKLNDGELNIYLLRTDDSTNSNKIFNLIINDLSKREFRDYNLLSGAKVIIRTSSKNIEILESNFEKQRQQELEQLYQDEIDNYIDIINDLNSQIEELNEKNYNNEELINELKYEIEEYKNKIKNILED